MKEKVKISIITVCLNSEKTIARTIESIKNQTYNNIEYIIIDGCSTDRTKDIIEQNISTISTVVSEKDNGLYDAMNKGIQLANGDIIGILNSDDWYEKNTLENVAKAFERSNSDIVYGKVRLLYPDGKIKIGKIESIENMWHKMPLDHPGVFVKKDVYKQVGMFDISYKIAADYDFLLRCYINGVSFFYINDILTNFSMTGLSNINGKLCNQETRNISIKYADKSPNPELVRKTIYERKVNERRLEIINNETERIASKIINSIGQRDIVIWGTGKWGMLLYNAFRDKKINIAYWIDSNPSKKDTFIEDIKVVSPESVLDKNLAVIIAISSIDEEITEVRKKIQSEGIYCRTLSEISESLMENE